MLTQRRLNVSSRDLTFCTIMEALQLKVENLGREISRIDAENKKLRDQHPERAAQVDAKRELEQAQADVAKLTEQAKAYEEQLAGAKQAVDAMERRATKAEGRAEEADRRAVEAERLAERRATEAERLTVEADDVLPTGSRGQRPCSRTPVG